MMAARSRSEAWATTSAALGPSPLMRMSSGPSNRNEKPRLAVSSCIEDTPTSRTTPSTDSWPSSRAARSRSEKRDCTRFSRPWAVSTSAAPRGDRRRIAVEPDHPRAVHRQDLAAIAAGSERAVDIDAAGAQVQPFDGRPAHHRDMGAAIGSGVRAGRHHEGSPVRPAQAPPAEGGSGQCCERMADGGAMSSNMRRGRRRFANTAQGSKRHGSAILALQRVAQHPGQVSRRHRSGQFHERNRPARSQQAGREQFNTP